ncbi:plasmid stabilization protein [Cellulomonas sp. IC4_254]|uniref:FitA-like ribbon-helix-helix domain-containing protein n=1 Tax=Cellulomonas sp. IC4_254 TaxID=2714040 RepID=UPI0014243D7B|nr:plasmid stabilization protein [Cellulomonas sp. IC4_254]NHT16814.1 plasmid stabilization protein [Cellulomonas sp. IC4_254]
MGTVTVRNLDDDIQRRLKVRAARHQRSMEAEARAILTAAVRDTSLARSWLDATRGLRGVDLELPERGQPRDLDLG